MSTENEDIEKDQENDKPEHDKSWLKEEIEELKEEATNSNEFPLSGAEGPNIVHDHHLDDEDEEHPDKKTFLDELDKEFPILGGEGDTGDGDGDE